MFTTRVNIHETIIAVSASSLETTYWSRRWNIRFIIINNRGRKTDHRQPCDDRSDTARVKAARKSRESIRRAATIKKSTVYRARPQSREF